MPQVVRTTNDVIINSLYLLGELGVGEVPDAFMLSTGLDLLNEILDKFSSDSIYIPYLTTLFFTMVPGKDTYSVSDIITGTDIVADRIVDLSLANYVVPGIPAQVQPRSSSFITDVPATSQLILASTNGFPTGTPVVLSNTNGTLPIPLLPNTAYYTILVDLNHLYLATSLGNALSGIFINLLSNSSGTGENIISTTVGTMPAQIGTSLSYPVRIINKAQYYGIVRQIGLLARPGFVFLNKQPTESFLTYYPAPDQPYPASVQVKVMINDLGNQDTLGELPPNYYGFLKYALARKFLAYYPSGNWPQTNEDEYQDYYMTLKNSNETDLTIRPSVTLQAPEPFYWPNILSY